MRAHWLAQRTAMIDGDTARLDELLDKNFTLTHMSGYVEPKLEWLADIESRTMRYHSIDDVDVEVDPQSSSLTVRTKAHASVWGGRGVKHMQLRIFFRLDGDKVLTTRAISSIW